jgi:predicted alpha/beta hydrolase
VRPRSGASTTPSRAPGVAKLSARFVRAPETRIVRVTPQEVGGPIGHFGFFKPRLADVLWPRAFAWLEGRTSDGTEMQP